MKLGGMDHLYRPAYWEDIDLSYRAWKRGWEVLFEPESKVHHEPESTNIDAFGKKRIRKIASKNQLLFVWKNIHDRKLIFNHLLWIPLRFFKAFFKGDSAFVLGTFQALLQFPEVIKRRTQEKRKLIISDSDVLGKIQGKT
jgi:GT2 family glycosyltransferase